MRLFICGSGGACETIYSQAKFLHDVDRFTNGDDVNEVGLWPWPHAHLIVSIGYLRIVKPATLLAAPAINCHYSLLPNHRGRSPVPWAIVDGDKVTGITWHWINEGIDTGRTLLQAACQIDDNETQATLFDKLHTLAFETWPHALALAERRFIGWHQVGRSQYHKAGPPHGGVIDALWDNNRIKRFIRAMTYPPLPYATYNGQPVETIQEFYDAYETATERP